jgi:hypothetical protein
LGSKPRLFHEIAKVEFDQFRARVFEFVQCHTAKVFDFRVPATRFSPLLASFRPICRRQYPIARSRLATTSTDTESEASHLMNERE